ncbi:Zinc finger protein ZnFP12 [Cricetulus griseus]|uniref:Zinc finger protein ZnFP12 n=1 Tax=Cricetulus griseus TaxID=10029 RepID=G3HMU6_CRIGR|nr:Zinc finger protein ZnFP12 [Cricetulus griseus]
MIFEDVAVNFTSGEWTLLDSSLKKLFRDLMKETFMNLISIEKTQEENIEEEYQSLGRNLGTQVVEKDSDNEHENQCEENQQQIPAHVVNEDMPPAVTLYESSLSVRSIIDNLPSDVQLSGQTKEKRLECKEPVEKAFRHEKCWAILGHPSPVKEAGTHPVLPSSLKLLGASLLPLATALVVPDIERKELWELLAQDRRPVS